MKRRIRASKNADLLTIDEAFREFKEEKTSLGRSDETIENYEQSLRLFITHEEIDKLDTVNTITVHNLYHWQNSLKEDGVTVASINHYLRDLRTFLYWCMDDSRGWLPKFKVQMVKGQEEPLKAFNDDDIDKLLMRPQRRRNSDYVEWRTWAIVNLVYGAGFRTSTICDLRYGDIDFRRKEIKPSHTKNKKTLIVPLSPATESAIKEFRRIYELDEDKEAYLFPNVGGERMTPNALRHAFSRYCKDREVEQTNLHGLRHSFALDWIKNDGNQFVLQEILGHSSLEMTKKYVRLSKEDMKKDYEAYSPLDRKKKASRRTKTIKTKE